MCDSPSSELLLVISEAVSFKKNFEVFTFFVLFVTVLLSSSIFSKFVIINY